MTMTLWFSIVTGTRTHYHCFPHIWNIIDNINIDMMELQCGTRQSQNMGGNIVQNITPNPYGGRNTDRDQWLI